MPQTDEDGSAFYAVQASEASQSLVSGAELLWWQKSMKRRHFHSYYIRLVMNCWQHS